MPRPALALVDYGTLLIVTILGAAARLATLGSNSLWFDEAAMYHLVQGDWHSILALNAVANSAPPLYPLLLGLTTGPDASEAMLRAPSVIAGILAIPLAYVLAREFVPSRFALLAPLLIALAPTQFEYSQEVREYSLTFCTACLILIAYERFIKVPGPRGAAWIAAATVLGISTQYGNALLAAGANIVCLAALPCMQERARVFRLWLLSQVPAAILASVLFVTTIRPQLRVSVVGKSGYLYLLDRYWDGTWPGVVTLLTGARADIVHFAFPGRAMLALVLAGALASALRPGTRRVLAFLAAPGAITLLAALESAYPFGGIRQDMFLLPMIYVSATAGLAAAADWLQPHVPRVALACGVVLVAAALAYRGLALTSATLGAGGPEPMRPVVAELKERLRPGERIYVYSGAIPAFRYYWRGRPEPWIQGALHWSGPDQDLANAQMITVHGELAALIADGAPFWIVASHLTEEDCGQLLEPVRTRREIELAGGEHGSWLYHVSGAPAVPAP